MYQIEKSKQQEEKKENKGGVLGGFFGWNQPKKEKVVVSLKDQLTQIFAIIREHIIKSGLEEIQGKSSINFTGVFDISKGKVKLHSLSEGPIKFEFNGLFLQVNQRTDGQDLEARIGNIGLSGIANTNKEIIPLVHMAEKGEEYFHLTLSQTNKDTKKYLAVGLETVLLKIILIVIENNLYLLSTTINFEACKILRKGCFFLSNIKSFQITKRYRHRKFW